jgi:PAS domain S-box-containing protein
VPSDSTLSALFSDSMLDLLPFSAQILDIDGTTLKVNRAWSALWHEPDDDSLLRYVLSGAYNVLTDPQLVASGLSALFARAYAGESVSLPEILYDPTQLGKPGRARWVKGYARPIRDAADTVIGVMLTHEDVTERVDMQQALRLSEERLRLATDAGRIGTWDWHIATDEVTWSERAYELHGVPMSEPVRSLRDNARVLHPDAAPEFLRKLQDAIAGGATNFTSDFKGVMPDGEERWFTTWAQIFRDEAGAAVRMIGASIDITERKRIEHALRAAVGELKDAGRRKDEFLAMLAHELRNPLAPISAGAELLQLRADDPARVRQASAIIARQVLHLAKLVDDLLDVSRVNRGLIRLDTETLDLSSAIDCAVEQSRPLIESCGHDLRLRVENSAMPVRADRARMIQVLANLLNNAAKYTPRGGRIELTAAIAGDEAVIEVRDNGIGIEAALLPHVFDFFVQGERGLDRSSGGLGIGLALVKSLVALQHGRVQASSDGAGKGSVFRIAMPLARGATASDGAAQPAATTPAAVANVLIVDDNLDAAETLAALLTAQGYRVTTAVDGAGALEAAGRAWPDVFVLDIGLPDMSGHELARRLRALDGAGPAMYIALTGYGQADDRAQSAAAGFDYHLVKPVGYEQLHALFSSGLDVTSGAEQGAAERADRQ